MIKITKINKTLPEKTNIWIHFWNNNLYFYFMYLELV